MEQAVRRMKGSQMRRFIDVVKENIKFIGVRKGDTEEIGRWR